MKWKCIAIDDEPLALDLVEGYINKIPFLELVGTYYNPLMALEVIKSDAIDLIFSDINMPDMIGVDFIKSLKNPPMVIFVTAYDQYAVQGFELSAVDYLLKPVSFDRFLAACEKFLEIKGKSAKTNPYLFIKANYQLLKVPIDDIYYVEGFKDYIKIFTNEVKPIHTLMTIKMIEDILPSSFIRIHKSFIISIDKLQAIQNGKILVKDKYLPIGDSYKEQVMTQILGNNPIK